LTVIAVAKVSAISRITGLVVIIISPLTKSAVPKLLRSIIAASPFWERLVIIPRSVAFKPLAAVKVSLFKVVPIPGHKNLLLTKARLAISEASKIEFELGATASDALA
jgi:hypothetical protein